MTRLEKLKSLESDFFYKKDIQKLKKEDWELLYNFLQDHEVDDYNLFAEAVNRMFLDGKLVKTKNYRSVQFLLDVLNKTIPGMYGWELKQEWVHPLDRKD